MEVFTEEVIIYGLVFIFCIVIIYFYLRKLRVRSKITEAKIVKAKADGMHEPVSLHPVINPDNCIQSGACVTACPEHDVIGIKDGIATIVNASSCIGHGACFHACPVQAISLVIGTEKRGVDLPHVNQNFETNVPGLYLASKKHGLKFLTLDQNTVGGTVYSFPRSKIVMTAPMDLPLFGKIKLFETSKDQLIDLWGNVLSSNDIVIRENTKVESIEKKSDGFYIKVSDGTVFTSSHVLLAIGRRGSPRKLNVQGEEREKVAYRLLEPELIEGKNILVVGGGDSAIESALLLADQNTVTLSYRSATFNRLKVKNNQKIQEAIQSGLVDVRFNSNVLSINSSDVEIEDSNSKVVDKIKNDQVYIFAGGELPTQFLEKIGVEITKRFGHTLLSHQKKGG
ncbi:MAG: NAD(P)-binding domain-containing protein [Saprospiraceae bacterium]|nr:NAD(P)-binding domain-containing protein [Saprospiraceae bacterium]